jgi:hypothetical protein
MKSIPATLNLKGIIAASLFLLGSITIIASVSPDTSPPSGGLNPQASLIPNHVRHDALTIFNPLKIFGLSEATVTTDRRDYAPGAIVQISGSGFWPNESVRLEVDHVVPALVAHEGHDPWFVDADANGNFTAEWLVDEDSLNETLRLTADGVASLLHAETTFTDSAVGTYDQCSNDDGDGYATGDTGCRWINGNLNANNSTYHEGDSTVQRLWMKELAPGSTHTVQLKYGTTKQGKHAYDYLTTFGASENWVTLADRCDGMDANGNSAGGDANVLILCGMVGFLTGVTRTPFTSAILVLEMTDRHGVIFQLMFAALMANVAGLMIMKHSLYEVLKRGFTRPLNNPEPTSII